MSDSIFTKIINWEIPCYKVFEDNLTFAFLNRSQKNPGNILIVPKVEVDHFFELDDDSYQAIFQTAKKLAPVLKQAFNSKRVWLVVEWLEVPHVHIKLFPINKAGDIEQNNDEFTVTLEEMLMLQKKIIDNL